MRFDLKSCFTRSRMSRAGCHKEACVVPQAVFNMEHDVRIVRAAMQKQNDATPVSLQDFQKRVKQGYQAFELLRTVAEGR